MRRPWFAARLENHAPTMMSVVSDSREQVEEMRRRLEQYGRSPAEAGVVPCLVRRGAP